MENTTEDTTKMTCKFWRQGRCSRNPCGFLHDSLQAYEKDKAEVETSGNETETTTSRPKVCKFWARGECTHDSCDFLHTSPPHSRKKRKRSHRKPQPLPGHSGYGFSLVTKLEGHTKAITGIVMSYKHGKLYSTSVDRTLRVWDCSVGQCVGCEDTGDCYVGCSVSSGSWLFLGAQDFIRARNLQNGSSYEIHGTGGNIRCMVFSGDMLFAAGTEDGIILIFKWIPEMNNFERYGLLKGHNASVCSLTAQDTRVFSGSKDGIIKVWDIHTMKCVQTISAHSKEVNSLLIWNTNVLLSGSMDKTLKGVVTLAGMVDEKNQSILFCSCSDHSVRLYELPEFKERGRILSRHPVRVVVAAAVNFLFLTGDGIGDVYVWRLAEKSPADSGSEVSVLNG